MKAGWIEHPGTHIGHYFAEGEYRSLCRRDMRWTNSIVKDEPHQKCSICEKRFNEPRTPNMFAETENVKAEIS